MPGCASRKKRSRFSSLCLLLAKAHKACDDQKHNGGQRQNANGQNARHLAGIAKHDDALIPVGKGTGGGNRQLQHPAAAKCRISHQQQIAAEKEGGNPHQTANAKSQRHKRINASGARSPDKVIDSGNQLKQDGDNQNIHPSFSVGQQAFHFFSAPFCFCNKQA